MAANSITVTGKCGPGITVTAQKISQNSAVSGITFREDGNIEINGQSFDVNACSTVTCVVTAGSPPSFAFTIS